MWHGKRAIRWVSCVLPLLCAVPALATDTDGDGIPDGIDICCNTPAGVTVDDVGRPRGDLDYDCDVDLFDFAILANNLTGPMPPVICPDCGDGVQNGDETDNDCGGPVCIPCANGLGCLVDSDCQSNVCNIGTNTCQAPSCTDVQMNGNETDVDCGGGICPPCPPGFGCLVSSDCTSFVCQGTICQSPSCADGVQNGTETGVDCGGSCAPCTNPDGAPCFNNSECQSTFCVDGVCCGSACNSLCMHCNLAGNVGSCVLIPGGTDPDNECAGASTCNGMGMCTSLSPNGVSCSTSSQCQSGFCVDGVCCNGNCANQCQACNLAGNLGTCSNIPNGADPANECAGASTCNGSGSCTTLLNNGSVCTTASQCLSGSCVDGVCCNTACASQCQACNLTGSVGSCANIPNGADPANECSGASVCNGAGSCTP